MFRLVNVCGLPRCGVAARLDLYALLDERLKPRRHHVQVTCWAHHFFMVIWGSGGGAVRIKLNQYFCDCRKSEQQVPKNHRKRLQLDFVTTSFPIYFSRRRNDIYFLAYILYWTELLTFSRARPFIACSLPVKKLKQD